MASAETSRRLSDLRRGERGIIAHVGAGADDALERRLLEMGFVEGAPVEVLHEGLIGRDPIAVRINDTRLALRRREAAHVRVRVET